MKQDALIQYVNVLDAMTHTSETNAHCLPGSYYVDDSVFDAEVDELRKEWFCIGRIDEIKSAGEYFTTTLLGESLLVVRGDDARIRVFANVCRHRNMRVANGCGKSKVFVCPYHAWSYGRDGRLVNAPLIPEEKLTDSVRTGLNRIRSQTWQGFVFVSLNPDARAFGSGIGALDDVLHNYHTEEMHHLFACEEVWRTNWKCLIENFLEGYHLSVVHRDTLHALTPTRLCEKIPGGHSFTGYRAYYPDTAGQRGDGHPDLTQPERRCSVLFCIYPGLLVSQSGSTLAYLSVHPITTDTVQVRFGVAIHEADLSETDANARVNLWEAINREDREKLEILQQTLGSVYAGSGPLAPSDFEGTIWDFYGYLSQLMNRS